MGCNVVDQETLGVQVIIAGRGAKHRRDVLRGDAVGSIELAD